MKSLVVSTYEHKLILVCCQDVRFEVCLGRHAIGSSLLESFFSSSSPKGIVLII